MSERGFRKEPLALGATTSQARHLGRRSGLVQEDHPVWLKPHDRLARRGPFLARLLYVGPIMLAGPQSFLEAIANADEPTRKRGGIGLLAGGGGQFGRQLRHGGVGLLGDLLQKKRPMRF